MGCPPQWDMTIDPRVRIRERILIETATHSPKQSTPQKQRRPLRKQLTNQTGHPHAPQQDFSLLAPTVAQRPDLTGIR